MLQTVELIVKDLGISGTYKGFYYLITAVGLISERPELLCALTKELYPAIARQHSVSEKCVERNLRTVVDVCWKYNRAGLELKLGRQMLKKPTVGEFISIVFTLCNHKV